MIKGTTPTLYFRIKNLDDFNLIADIWVTIKSTERKHTADKKIPNSFSITKKYSEEQVKINKEEKIVYITLLQEDTLKLYKEAEVQLKILLNDDTVLASPIALINIYDVLNKNIMTTQKEDVT